MSPPADGFEAGGAPHDARVADASGISPEERRLTLRLPPVMLAIPLLAIAAYGVIRTEPWQPRPATASVDPGVAASTAEPPLRDAPEEDALDAELTPEPGRLPEPGPLPEPQQSVPLQEVASTAPSEPVPGAPRAATAEPLARREPDGARSGLPDPALARALEEVAVVVYYAQWCGYCQAARTYLARRGIRSVEYDIDRDADAGRRHQRLNPRGSVPTIDIDGRVLVGFDAESIERALQRAARARLDRGS